jgi:RNA polymerase sigma-70 factor, ECF subfamily
MPDRAEGDRLIDAARSGDEDAWEVLYRQIYHRLFAFLARRVGPGEAEDAVNETMARAVAGIENLRGAPGGFDGWVFGIARRVSADVHRQAQRSYRQAGGFPVPESVANNYSDPGESTYLAEEHRRVREAFDLLTPHERELLELRVVARMSAEEVAKELDMKPGAVRTAQSRALSHLRILLRADDATFELT